MDIKGVKFSNCFLSSGSFNFFGDGYWYDDWFSQFMPGFSGFDKATFVAKTTTLNHRAGNMPLNRKFRPKELKPNCILVYPLKGMIINAVGLSGPGAQVLLDTGRWQKINQPFFISFMAVANTSSQRLDEAKKFVDILGPRLSEFKTQIGLQVNVSCPNTKHATGALAQESLGILKELSALGLPLDLKVNIFASNEMLKDVQQSGLCEVLTISNTIPYGSEGLDWDKLFGQNYSPLFSLGGGGLSGAPILPLVLKRIAEIRAAGISMPIKGSGGITSVKDVSAMKLSGANAIEIGSVLILRPWRVNSIIKYANEIF